MITPPFTISNKIPVTTSAATFRKQVLAGKRLIGVGITDGALSPQDPDAAAKLVLSHGASIFDMQHLEVGLDDGWLTVEGILAFLDRIFANGGRASMRLFSKLGELSPRGMGGFKSALMDQAEDAESLLEAHIVKIRRILEHPALFLVCLSNECAHLTTPDKAKRFWEKWAPKIRALNPNLLLTDMPDAWDQAEHPSPWADVAALYDVISAHFYGGGEDFGPNGKGTWIGEGWKTWKLRLFVTRARELAGVKKPVVIQEFASYNVNPNYVANEIYLQTLAALEGWSTFQFAFATNQDCWDGKGKDVYATVTDPARLKTLLYGAYLLKNQTGLTLDHWDGTLGKWGPNINVSGSRVSMDQNNARVNSYVWRTDQCPDWARLTKVV
jgi:hypothetical protein